MKVQKFADIIAWQKGLDLVVIINNHFKDSKEFTFKDQIFRASVSITNNIAEGLERNSDKEFIRFLYISKGSNSEVKSMLYVSKHLKFMTEIEFNQAKELTEEIGRILNGLINSIKKQSTNKL
jgi:four helix bundle protein